MTTTSFQHFKWTNRRFNLHSLQFDLGWHLIWDIFVKLCARCSLTPVTKCCFIENRCKFSEFLIPLFGFPYLPWALYKYRKIYSKAFWTSFYPLFWVYSQYFVTHVTLWNTPTKYELDLKIKTDKHHVNFFLQFEIKIN